MGSSPETQAERFPRTQCAGCFRPPPDHLAPAFGTTPHPPCSAGLLPRSQGWFPGTVTCSHSPCPAPGIGWPGLRGRAEGPGWSSPSGSLHPCTPPLPSRAPLPHDLVPQQAPGQRALLLSLPWLPRRHSGAQQPLRLCTCSPSGFIKSLLIGCVSTLASSAQPPQVFILPQFCWVAVTGGATAEVGERGEGRQHSGAPRSHGLPFVGLGMALPVMWAGAQRSRGEQAKGLGCSARHPGQSQGAR